MIEMVEVELVQLHDSEHASTVEKLGGRLLQRVSLGLGLGFGFGFGLGLGSAAGFSSG